MYFYIVKIQAVTSKNREIQRSVIAMAASPWEAMKNVSAERDEGYECIIISDILYEDAGYKMEND